MVVSEHLAWLCPSLGVVTLSEARAFANEWTDSSSACRYKLNIWDVGGQTTLRSYWRNYYEQTEGLIWVIDSTDVRRLKDCKEELHKLLVEERLAGATLLIFANKQDISGAQSSEELLKALELDKMGERHWKIVSCSGITGDGVSKGLNWVVEDIAARIYMFNS